MEHQGEPQRRLQFPSQDRPREGGERREEGQRRKTKCESHTHTNTAGWFSDILKVVTKHPDCCNSKHFLLSLTETSRKVCTQEDEVTLVKVDTGGAQSWTLIPLHGRISHACSSISLLYARGKTLENLNCSFDSLWSVIFMISF